MKAFKSHIYADIEKYFSLFKPYFDRGGKLLTFDRGYWWTPDDDDMRSLEEKFLEYGKDWERLHAVWKDVQSPRQRANTLHLMGWSIHVEKVAPILLTHLKDPATAASNAAARALFPWVVHGTCSFDISHVLVLLHRRSKYHKNKALGLLLYWPRQDEVLGLSAPEKEYIRGLAKKSEPMFALLAQQLTERFDA